MRASRQPQADTASLRGLRVKDTSAQKRELDKDNLEGKNQSVSSLRRSSKNWAVTSFL